MVGVSSSLGWRASKTLLVGSCSVWGWAFRKFSFVHQQCIFSFMHCNTFLISWPFLIHLIWSNEGIKSGSKCLHSLCDSSSLGYSVQYHLGSAHRLKLLSVHRQATTGPSLSTCGMARRRRFGRKTWTDVRTVGMCVVCIVLREEESAVSGALPYHKYCLFTWCVNMFPTGQLLQQSTFCSFSPFELNWIFLAKSLWSFDSHMHRNQKVGQWHG